MFKRPIDKSAMWKSYWSEHVIFVLSTLELGSVWLCLSVSGQKASIRMCVIELFSNTAGRLSRVEKFFLTIITSSGQAVVCFETSNDAPSRNRFTWTDARSICGKRLAVATFALLRNAVNDFSPIRIGIFFRLFFDYENYTVSTI